MTITRRSFVRGGIATLGVGSMYPSALAPLQERDPFALQPAELDTLVPELLGSEEMPGASIAVVSEEGPAGALHRR